MAVKIQFDLEFQWRRYLRLTGTKDPSRIEKQAFMAGQDFMFYLLNTDLKKFSESEQIDILIELNKQGAIFWDDEFQKDNN